MNLLLAPPDKVAMKDNMWCQTLGQFTGAYISDLNPNSSDISNMKFDLIISTKVRFISSGQGI